MIRTSLLLVCVLFYAGAEARRHFGNCPSMKTENFDNKMAKGTWYVYANNPSNWVEKCFTYDITSDEKSNYYVKESFINDYKVFHTTTNNDYTLDYSVSSPDVILRKKVAKFIPTKEVWQLVHTDEYNSFMILYRCGPTLPWWQKEEIQIWARDANLVSGVEVPEKIKVAISTAGFQLSELQFKKIADCKK